MKLAAIAVLLALAIASSVAQTSALIGTLDDRPTEGAGGAFRIYGSVDIGGRKTLMSFPFNRQGAVDIRYGMIGIDLDGDGAIDPSREFTMITGKGDPVIFRVRDRFVSIEAADFAKHSFVLREHPASDYRIIEVRVGAPLEDFSFTDFDGRTRKLSSLRGKYLLMDFWGSWCGPCVADLPLMRAAYDKFKDGLEILGVDHEYSLTADQMRPFLKDKGLIWPNITPESAKDLVENRFRTMAFPTLILIDRDGVVIDIRYSAKDMLPVVERLLNKDPQW